MFFGERNKDKILMLFILVLALFLRFWQLGSYPALNADEASNGYDAYSLILTGKDQHGNPWPVHFQSFNDFKPGLYVYLVLPFIKLFGLTVWSVRIPGALLGVATVYLVYLLIKELAIGSSRLPILGAVMLAISPWHLHFSRGGWEVNVATFLMTLGVWLFIRGIKAASIKYQLLSVTVFSLSLYTYHAPRIVVPLLGVGLVVLYWKEVKKHFRNYLIAALLAVVLLAPLIVDFARPEVGSRAAGVGLFADPGPLSRINEQRGEHSNFSGLAAKLLHNKGVNYALAFAQNWAEHFHGEFLFLSGDVIQRNQVPETGQMYMIDLLFVVFGFAFFVQTKKASRKSKLVVFYWLIVAPTAAALTFQSPHALRAQNMVIPLIIISATGLDYILGLLTKFDKLRLGGWIFLLAAVFWSFMRYEHNYWKHMATKLVYSSQYGVSELSHYLAQNGQNYNHVIVTDRYDQPYILLLFYARYDPAKFQANHVLTGRDEYGFSTVDKFDKYEFKQIDFDKVRPESPDSLIVGTDEEIPDEANIVKEIYGANDYKYFQIVAN